VVENKEEDLCMESDNEKMKGIRVMEKERCEELGMEII